jgi:SpoVK/Ycf46/Vps4 family AAA+-type ATPase
VLSWPLPVASREERRELWHAALSAGVLADRLAHEHRHGSGRISQLARLARHRATLDGSARPALSHVADAAWAGEGLGLEALSQWLRDAIFGEVMVMTPVLRHDLETLFLRCRSRDVLERGQGASATRRYRPSVRALFIGASGRGKTLAASWLATRLQMPLYSVDFASVTGKYIGETERNLAQLLAHAEQAEVVLLFDEADSMFGKCTEVKEANDRFASAETSYLLQRIETFDGMTLLTSNSKSRFDAVFMSCFDLNLDFPLPGSEERRALWLSRLGTHHALTIVQVNQFAVVVKFGGGHIRNAVLTAAVLAPARGEITECGDLVPAVNDEYHKLGRQVPAELGAKV